MAKKAVITVAVTKFVDVLNTAAGAGKRACTADVKLTKDIPGVITQNGVNAPIIVKAPVDVRFDMLGNSTFELAGIAFRNNSPAFRARKKKPLPAARQNEKGNGNENLPKSSIFISEEANDDTSIYVSDVFATPANTTTKWEYYLMVQNADGVVGLIDPDIQNEN